MLIVIQIRNYMMNININININTNIITTGHLKPGQETTTNTYQGHVFFFTLSADRSVEVARYYIHPEQV